MKKITCLFLCLALFISTSGSIFAETTEEMTLTNSLNETVTVTIPDEYRNDISTSELQSIIDSNPECTNIIIHEVGVCEEQPIIFKSKALGAPVLPPIVVNPIPYPVPFTFTTTETESEVFESDRFMASCARGEVLTLKSAITEKLTLSFEGDIRSGSGGLKNEISYTMEKGKTYTGPETPNANTREFRCKFYENKGTWSQVWMVNGVPTVKAGTYSEPEKYMSYSLDKYVTR